LFEANHPEGAPKPCLSFSTKAPFIMKPKLILLLILPLCFISLEAQVGYPQDFAILDTNDMRVAINCGGDLGWDLAGDPRFEVPKNGGSHALHTGHLWMGGIDGTGQLRVAGQTYRQNGIDYWPGPVAQNYDSAYFARYGKVFKVTSSEIEDHKVDYGNPSYVTPPSIRNWPAHGDTLNGEPWSMAPFEDANQNGVYEPGMGDYPKVPGDMAAYLIFSDAQYPNSETNGERLYVDVHMLAYQYDAPLGTALSQTLFLSYRVVNRRPVPLSDFYLGLWMDFDLGFFNDDFQGCDSGLNAFFVYNSDNDDEGTFNYGLNPPAFGVKFLNQPLTHFLTHRPDFSSYGHPRLPAHFYGYLQATWGDSTPVTYGGDGTMGTQPTSFMYPGDPRDTSQWSEMSAGNLLLDAKGVGSLGPVGLGPSGSLCLDVALVFGRDLQQGHLGSVDILKNRFSAVQAFYDTSLAGCQVLEESTVGIAEVRDEKADFSLFPNPVTDVMHLQLPQGTRQLQLIDAMGRELWRREVSGQTQLEWDLSGLTPGVYFCRVDNRYSRKFVKR
jgi:hypothetical protein